MLAELQTKTVFRNSYGPVALADLNAQARGFGDYLSALGWLTSVGRFAYPTSPHP